MKIIPLYEYFNEDNSVEITPNPHNPEDISNGYRLIAENGMELYYNETNTQATVRDVEQLEGWSEQLTQYRDEFEL